MPKPHIVRIALVMCLRHAVIGGKGYAEVGSEWLVGNPWHDIYIHVAFVLCYVGLSIAVWRRYDYRIFADNRRAESVTCRCVVGRVSTK